MASKDAVILELKHSVDHHLRIINVKHASNAVRRKAITKMLEEIAAFLTRWEQEFSNSNKNFPTGVLREGFASLLTQVGPGDGQMRAFLLKQLSNVKIPSCRQLLLDFLPSTMPTMQSPDGARSQELDDVTTQVLETLRSVLTNDPGALLPVLGCLSVMPLSEAGRKESFQVSLTSLEFVSESDLPVLVTNLLRHADSEEDARKALDALRSELEVVESADHTPEKGDDPITMVTHVLLNALFDDERNNQNATAYVTIFERITNNTTIQIDSQTRGKGDKTGEDDNNTNSFLLLDLAALMLLCQHPDFMDTMESRMDSLLKHDTFPFEMLERFLSFICGQKRFGRPTSILYRRLISPMVSFGIFLLLAPVRICGEAMPSESVYRNLQAVTKKTQNFLVNLHHHADREIQAEIVHSLLHLSEESANSKWDVSSSKSLGGRKRSSKQKNLVAKTAISLSDRTDLDDGDYQWFQVLVDDAVNDTLKCMAHTSKASFANFKHILLGRLTSRSFRSTFWERHCMKHLCSLLSMLFEPAVSSRVDSGGIQASEIMILLQKLLFTSSFVVGKAASHTQDDRRVVRGLLLATELVKSPFLGQGDWDCVKQWVLRILLPPTRRMVDPEIGSPGLDFLEALMMAPTGRVSSESLPQTLKTENFQHMKMVLANTGLIQMLAHYQQQQNQKNKSSNPILAYMSEPDCLFSVEINTKRKRRSMVFCLAYFLQNSDLYFPNHWDPTIRWIFHLVDTYLRIGRDVSLSSASKQPISCQAKESPASGKWVPHGWLQAAIEYPSLDLPPSVKAISNKQQVAMNWIKFHFSRYEKQDENDHSVFGDENVQGGLIELFSASNGIGQLKQISRSACLLSISLLLGISVSFAVVRNSYAHLQSMTSSTNKMSERNEILRLLQFQMAKVYDMKRRCQSMNYLLDTLVSSVSTKHFRLTRTCYSQRDGRKRQDNSSQKQGQEDEKTSETSGTEETQLRVDLESAKRLKEESQWASRQLGNILSQLFSSRTFTTPDVLFDCLMEEQHSRMLLEALYSVIKFTSPLAASEQNSLIRLMGLRESILEHVTALLAREPSERKLIETNRKERSQISRERFANCVDMALELCLMLPKLRKVAAKNDLEKLNKNVSSLAAAYMRLVSTVFTEPQKKAKTHPTTGSELASATCEQQVDACVEIFKKKDVISSANNCGGSVVEVAFAGFLRILQNCEDRAIATELLENLSVLASSSGGRLTREMLSVSWKALHTVYSSSWEKREHGMLSFALIRMLELLEAGAPSKRHSAIKVLQDTVLKQTSKKGRSKESSSGLRRDLLRHWGLFILYPEVIEDGIENLLSVFEEISFQLQPVGGSSGSEHYGGEEKKDDEKKRANLHHASSIPDLSGESLVGSFETMIHVTVASMALINVWKGLGRRGSDVGDNELGPYGSFVKLTRLFSGLLELYERNIDCFPKWISSTLLSASRHMLHVTVTQLQECVAWRNSQPLLSTAERSKGCYDPGAMVYLQNLIDTCWRNTAGKLLEFCEVVIGYDKNQPAAKSKKQAKHNADVSRNDGDEDMNGFSTTSEPKNVEMHRRYSQHAKFHVLRYSIDKVAQTLRNIAVSHNLIPPSEVEGETKEVRPRKRKSRSEDNAGYHQLDKVSKSRQVASILRKGTDSFNKKQRSLLESGDESGSEASTSIIADWKSSRHYELDDNDHDEGEGGYLYHDAMSNSMSVEDSELSDENQDSSKFFGATGNWGGNDDASEAGSSTGSLGLEVETPLF